eukprot:3565787-Rhodomonas_salina.1
MPLRYLRRMFPPIVTGVCVLLIGIGQARRPTAQARWSLRLRGLGRGRADGDGAQVLGRGRLLRGPRAQAQPRLQRPRPPRQPPPTLPLPLRSRPPFPRPRLSPRPSLSRFPPPPSFLPC